MIFNRVTPVNTTPVTDNVYVIKTGQVNFYIYLKDGNAISIDAGFGKSVIIRELKYLSIAPDIISHIFLTHTDFDHVGGIRVFNNARVYMSKNEEVMVNKTNARKYGFIYNKLSCDSYELLDDDEVISIGSINVKSIQTPGHTPGSTSYLVDNKFLFTGDAFRIIDERVCPIKPIFTMNTADQIKSIYRIANIPNIKMVFTAHRGYTNDFYGIMKDYTNGYK